MRRKKTHKTRKKSSYKKRGARRANAWYPPNPLEGGFSAILNLLLSRAYSNDTAELVPSLDWDEHRLMTSVVTCVAARWLPLAISWWARWKAERLRREAE